MQFSPKQQEVTIGGVPVLFPFKPYPSQVAMMAKVIQSLNQGTNALLESPTGSGKSLALLCSSLAWLYQQRDRKTATACKCSCHSSTAPIPCQNGIKTEGSTHSLNETKSLNDVRLNLPAVSEKGGVAAIKEKGVVSATNDVDNDFRRPRKRYRTPGGVVNLENKKTCVKTEEGEVVSWMMEVDSERETASQLPSVMDTGIPSTPITTGSSCPSGPSCPSAGYPVDRVSCDSCNCGRGDGTSSSGALPKVYFGTRTHQQIAQITHELAKTAYTATPMCVMGSREQACIHPDVSKTKRKNDECKKVLEEGMCPYYYRVAKKLGSQAQLLQHGMTTAWDMEDLVGLGKRVKACPYFAIRGIKEEAQIVFCPYNYLIDPLIRDQMLIELSGQIVVFDEAHNMEDAAREAASISISSLTLDDMMKELTEILDTYGGQLRPSFEYLAGITTSVKKWIDGTVSAQPHDGFDQTCGIWTGQDFIPVLKTIGIIQNSSDMIRSNLKAITDAVNEQKRNEEQGEQSTYIPSPSTVVVSILKGLAMVLSCLFRQEQKFADDYRISLMRTRSTKAIDDGWRRRRRTNMTEQIWLYTLNFWCLNPSVAFSELSCAHSVILTSGTLSPLSSFSSELGIEFKVQLEATHVVPETQTFIRSISCGPNNRPLCATYQNSETYEFQDEVGSVIDQVCQVVPDGVLCFFSSYKMLHKLTQRWQMTGLWGSIEKKKTIITEPNGSNKAEFEAAMRQFYTAIREGGGGGGGAEVEGVTGALFLAVCRGKVSEGLDFSDHNARAVITVGIPFPSIKDKQVELKREYNNQYCRSRGLLSGSEWYDIQAFRAINQALGRCIRHRDDWGALVLVDDRFSKGLRYTRGLSKWIRKRLLHEMNFRSAMNELTAFSKRMTPSHECCTDKKFDSSNLSFSTSKLQFSPSLSSHHHSVVCNTPMTQGGQNGRIKWKPPYNTSTPSTATPSSPTLSNVISQLRRSFRYPNSTTAPTASSCQPHSRTEKSELNDSVEITCVESGAESTLLVESSPPPLPTAPTPTTPSMTQSPLLFTESSVTPTSVQPKTQSPSPSIPNTNIDVTTAPTTDDNDTTPPLSPRQPVIIEDGKMMKSVTPLRKIRANTRLARRKGVVYIDDSRSSGCGLNERMCSICQSVICTALSSVERCVLSERLGQEVINSRLYRELGTVDDVILISPSNLVHCQSKDDGRCNAVWDEGVGMCFGILECKNGHVVGVRVHLTRNMELDLVNKVLLSLNRTTVVHNKNSGSLKQ